MILFISSNIRDYFLAFSRSTYMDHMSKYSNGFFKNGFKWQIDKKRKLRKYIKQILLQMIMAVSSNDDFGW